ncbi:hypothetical protein B0H11DRAFT_2129379 [Mycena galericulata]|nr:hypothetical protein B0H11DRAFT_2129379 [Mycena galericulata]
MHAHLLNFRPDWPNGMLPPRPRSASTDLPPPNTSFASLANGSPPSQAKSEVAKSVIEWLLVGIALILLACLLLRRMLRWREMHPDPYRNVTYAEAQRATDVERLYTYGLSGIVPYPPPIYARPRAAEPPMRGVDVRRAGGDMDPEVVLSMGEKDVLPVYDGRDRPPRYAENASGAA